MTPLPKPRARGIAAQLRRDLKQPGDDTWLPIPMKGVGSANQARGADWAIYGEEGRRGRAGVVTA